MRARLWSVLSLVKDVGVVPGERSRREDRYSRLRPYVMRVANAKGQSCWR